MRVRTILLLLVLAFVTACSAGNGTGSDSTNSTGVVGVTTYPVPARRPAPHLAGLTLDGRSVSTTSVAMGGILVINVWASWCGPCRSESPMLAGAAKNLRRAGVRFLGIDEQDTTSRARAFVASVGSTYPNLVDADGSLLRRLTLLPQVGVPSTLVLDQRGRMAARVIGPMTSQQLAQIVKGLQQEA
jgi:thiol-disulfide isomerase/thioredoxin